MVYCYYWNVVEYLFIDLVECVVIELGVGIVEYDDVGGFGVIFGIDFG